MTPPTEERPGRRDEDGALLYYARCGWCGAYEGTVSPGEPCARDSATGEYIGPHQFGVFERAPAPPTEGTGANDPPVRDPVTAGGEDAEGFSAGDLCPMGPHYSDRWPCDACGWVPPEMRERGKEWDRELVIQACYREARRLRVHGENFAAGWSERERIQFNDEAHSLEKSARALRAAPPTAKAPSGEEETEIDPIGIDWSDVPDALEMLRPLGLSGNRGAAYERVRAFIRAANPFRVPTPDEPEGEATDDGE